jgi:kinesin family protein C1
MCEICICCQILAAARKLEDEAEWSYTMGASFIEVYNQGLRDLLTQGANIADQNAIKHDPNGGHTTVSGAPS